MPDGNSPFIESGPDAGRVADPTIAHEAGNIVDNIIDNKHPNYPQKPSWLQRLWYRATKLRSREADKQSTVALVHSAQKTVVTESKLVTTEQQRDTDPLMGLISPRNYESTVEQGIKEFQSYAGSTEGRRILAIAKLDLDLFSWWNDLGGMNLGDLTLATVGRIIRHEIRLGDLAIRRGGEEIVIIPQSADSEGVKADIARIQAHIRTDALDEVIHILSKGKRKIEVKTSKGVTKEREGTVVLRGFAQEILKQRRENYKKFREEGKGGKKKERVLKLFDDLETRKIGVTRGEEQFFQVVDGYVSDTRTTTELESEDRSALQKRIETEDILCGVIREIYQEITCAAGVIVFTEEDRNEMLSVAAINAMTDSLNHQAKAYERNGICIQIGKNTSIVNVDYVPRLPLPYD